VGSVDRRITHWIGKAIVWLVVALLVLAVVGAIYQAIATGRAYPSPGEMVDVGDHRMQITCVGQGSPTVVLDAALGAMSVSWKICRSHGRPRPVTPARERATMRTHKQQRKE
jgi:hypothetical protein